MPFFQPVVHNEIILGCVSLRVQGPKTKKKEKIIKTKKSIGKRAYLFTSKGSITVEASIAITVFALMMLSIIGYLTMMNEQLAHQVKINNIAVAMSKIKFYKQIMTKIHGDNTQGKIVEEQEKQLNREINTSGEQVKENDMGELDIVYRFFYNVPWINKKVQITQRCLIKDWTGRDIQKQQEFVYITKNGKVYHLSKECSHLSIHIRKVTYSQLPVEKNCYGYKYRKCAICVSGKLSDKSTIFVTEDGTKYHNSLMCSGLIRNIITVEKSEVKNMPPCSRCAGE